MPGDYDGGDYVLLMAAPGDEEARAIDGFMQLTDWAPDKDPNLRRGPGGKVYGRNKRKHDDSVTFTLEIDQTSTDMQFLRQLVENDTPVSLKAIIMDDFLDNYEAGQEIGIGGQKCWLSGGTTSVGQDDGDTVRFDVEGFGFFRDYKQESSE